MAMTGGGVSGAGAEIWGLGKATEVVADVQQRRPRRCEASFVGGLGEAAAEELEGEVVVGADGEKRDFLYVG